MTSYTKAVIRFLLGLYVFTIFKPLFPYLEYAFNKSFIIQQLCENRTKPELNCEGSCYLSKRLAQTEEPQPASQSPIPPKHNFEQDSFHLRQSETTISDHPSLSRLANIDAAAVPPSQFAADIFHPPRTTLALL